MLFRSLDDGGYDPQGTYFGVGEPLYWVASDDGTIDRVFRVSDDNAKAQVLKWYPNATVTEEIETIGTEVSGVSLDAFTNAYLESALVYSHDDAEVDLNLNYCPQDFTADALKQCKQDCEDFQRDNAADLALAYDTPRYCDINAGGDFWLSRNGYGAGFQDRGRDAVWRRLASAAKAYGTVYIMVTEDKKLSTS